MKTIFPPTILVSRCYSEVTPESAEEGDFSDSGFIYEAQEMTPEELLREIERDGFTFDGSSDWLSTGYYMENYATGTKREETLHFCRENHPRMRKHFDRIAAIATRC